MRPTSMINGSECCMVDRRLEQNVISVVEIKMHGWMRGLMRKDRIKSDYYVRCNIVVRTSIVDKISKN